MKDTPIDSSPKDSGGGGSNDPSNRDDDILVRVGLLPPGHQPLHLAQREDNEKTSIVIRYVEDVDEFRQLSELRRKVSNPDSTHEYTYPIPCPLLVHSSYGGCFDNIAIESFMFRQC